MTTEAERRHAIQHRVSTWHHTFDVEAWGDRGVRVDDPNDDDGPPILMLRDRGDWLRVVDAVEHAFACTAQPSKVPIVPTENVDSTT